MAKNHKWRKGEFPQLCTECGILRSRKTFALRMAIVGNKDYFKYETKMVYTDINGTTVKRPECGGVVKKLNKALVIKSVCEDKVLCFCQRGFEGKGLIYCDNSCKQTVL